MKLSELLKGVEYEILQGDIDIDIDDVAYDSRNVKENALFVCVSGYATDGHGFISPAHEKGAKAIIVEKDLAGCHLAMEKAAAEKGYIDTYVPYSMTVIKVENARKALAIVSATWFGNPADKLTIIGLTGTKGKTTTAHMVRSIFDAAGKKTAMIGTIGIFIADEKIPSKNTTPDSFELQKLFSRMLEVGVTHCVMEVSSHALMLYRTYGINFECGAFLNISPDHIGTGPGDHADFEEYISEKAKIFSQTDNAFVNIDNADLAALAKAGVESANLYTISTVNEASVYVESMEDIWEPDILGSKIVIKESEDFAKVADVAGEYIVPMPGRYNAENALIAISICGKCGISKDAIAKGLAATVVKGRTQVIREAAHIATVIIDYAHNALSMESLLSMLKGYNPERLICLFGGGGDRPKDRRYDMGKAASKYADLTILTEDNPRYEEIENINNDIIVGLNVYNGKYDIIIDRKEAIEYLLDNAKPGDIIALIGKGHETYQDVKGVKTHFSEEEIIKEYVASHK